MTTTYYARIDENPESKTYGKKQSVHRMIREGDTLLVERWDGSEWVDNPNLIRHTGIGGDEDYQKIDESKAKKFINSRKSIKKEIIIKGGPGSGHFGHAGNPPHRGGSLPGSGVGAAMSVFTGKHARVRQYLRSQGFSKKDVKLIIASGAADTGNLALVGHKGDLLHRMGIAQVQPVIDIYKKRVSEGMPGMTAARKLMARNKLIMQLGGNPGKIKLSTGVQRLDTVEQLVAQAQGRLNVGRPAVGDFFVAGPESMPSWLQPEGTSLEFIESGTVWEVMDVSSHGTVKVLSTQGEEKWIKPGIEGQGGDLLENAIAIAEPKFTTEQRFARGVLQVGDKFKEPGMWEGDESLVFEVVDVGKTQDGKVRMWLKDSQGRDVIRNPLEIRENAQPLELPKPTKAPKVGGPIMRVGPVGESTLNLMRTGEIVKLDTLTDELINGGISETFVGMAEDGTQVLVKDSDRGYNESELVAYELSHAMGAEGMATQAVIIQGGINGGRVARVWAEGETLYKIEELGEIYKYEDKVIEEDFEKMAIMVALGGGTDLHGHNFILTNEGKAVIVDNDFLFKGGRGLGRWDQENPMGFVDSYFRRAAIHYRAITGENLTINSASITWAVENVALDPDFLDFVEDHRGSREREALEARLTILSDAAHEFDTRYGGSRTY